MFFNEQNFFIICHPEKVNQHIARSGWVQPTPIQSLGWPLALSGKNMVAIAQTGSGKTLGVCIILLSGFCGIFYVLPLLSPFPLIEP